MKKKIFATTLCTSTIEFPNEKKKKILDIIQILYQQWLQKISQRRKYDIKSIYFIPKSKKVKVESKHNKQCRIQNVKAYTYTNGEKPSFISLYTMKIHDGKFTWSICVRVRAHVKINNTRREGKRKKQRERDREKMRETYSIRIRWKVHASRFYEIPFFFFFFIFHESSLYFENVTLYMNV